MSAKARVLGTHMVTLANFLNDKYEYALLAVICLMDDGGAVVLAPGRLAVPPAAQEAAQQFVDAMALANNPQDRVEGPN